MYYEVKLSVEKEVPCKPSKAGATACELKQVNEHYICECETLWKHIIKRMNFTTTNAKFTVSQLLKSKKS